MHSRNADQGRAATYLSRINRELIKAAAQSRQYRDAPALGARLPASIAGARPRLTTVRKAGREGGGRMTLPGHSTARRGLPRILAGLDQADPRLAAAMMLADAFERVGSVQGASFEGSDVQSAGVPDGGATTRLKHSARLRLIRALANGWPIDRRHGPAANGAPRVLMAPVRFDGIRQEIRAFDAIRRVAVEGESAAEILRAHGWVVKARYQVPLGLAILATLDDVAAGLGLGRSAADDGA